MREFTRAVHAALLLFIFPLGAAFADDIAGGDHDRGDVGEERGGKPREFVSFQRFLEGVRKARYEDYARRAGSKVDSPQAFEDMRRHVLYMYEDVVHVSSFVVDVDYVDCITIQSQPTVHHLGLETIAEPPHGTSPETTTLDGGSNGSPGAFTYADSVLRQGLRDRFGNAIACAAGTVPMSRLTLETLVRFRRLSEFFDKVPSDLGRVRTERGEPEFLPDWDTTHLHAFGDQSVTNYGGNSWLNLWNPSGDFTLSQQWYSGGVGDGHQTVEGGWVAYPDKFHTASAVLFIFWTADNYGSKKCYNLDCTAFVQINNYWHLGGTWTNYSSDGGTQWGFGLQWKLYKGNWWLFVRGPGDYEAVGYYPTSLFGAGQLSRSAQRVTFGGETTRKVGNDWPQMGSGALASGGWQHAAFQNTVFYIPRDEDDGTGVWTDLTTRDEALASCYSIALTPAASGGDWGTYFFFGGPGGSTCQ